MASQPRLTDGRVPLAPVGLIVVSAGILGLAAGAAAGGTSLSPLTWYLARASGLTLYLLLWLSVVSGLAMTTKLPRALAGGGQSWLMHRVTSELAIVMRKQPGRGGRLGGGIASFVGSLTLGGCLANWLNGMFPSRST